MITVINTIRLPNPLTRDEARKIFLSTAPTYRHVPGLLRKCYVLSDDGYTVGGVYLWNSREEAQAMYTDQWHAFVRERYGAPPSIVYLDTPVVVDNTTHEIVECE